MVLNHHAQDLVILKELEVWGKGVSAGWKESAVVANGLCSRVI